MYKTLKDTFNAFDKDGNAELGFPEYVESWKFLGQPGTDQDIKNAFDSVDIDMSGLVEWDEFVFSIMGEAALKYGTLADMEKLTTLLDATLKDYGMIQDALAEARANNDTRATRNAELRNRLENMKGDVQSTVNSLIAQMMNIDPRDVLSEAEIDHHLETAFTKFDKDNSGELGDWEFKQAWVFLGLKGSEREIADAFKSVDKNNSGLIDMVEFKTAIKSERMAELSLTAVLEKMGVNIANANGAFDRFKATAQRRRLMKKSYEDNVLKLTKDIIAKLSMMSKREIPAKNAEEEKVYNTLLDTFNAFDKDGTGEMAYEEYVEAWKFLGRGTDEDEISKTFNSVDVDGSGLIEWNEFVFSLMGEKAMNYGVLAQLETLNNLLIDTSGLLNAMRADLEDAHLSAAERAERNSDLRKRLEGMQGEMQATFGNVFSKMLNIIGKDPADLLTDEQINKLLMETFKKFDKDNSGELECPEFIKAWRFLGLKGDDREITRAFNDVDTNSSGKIDRLEFAAAIKGNRTEELSLSVLLTQMDGHLEGMEGFFSEYKRKVQEAEEEARANLALSRGDYAAFQKATRRRRMRKRQMEENIAAKTHELVVQLKDIAGEEMAEDDGLKMFKQLKDTFNAFDKDGNGELGYPEYNEAWKFLGQPGDDSKIKAAFDGVDIDQSGLVEWSEFVFSIMGEAATKYGVLADMEDLERLLKNTVSEYKILRETLQEVRANNDVRAERNARLRQRLQGMKDEVGAQMNELFANMAGVRPEDVMSEAEIDAHLKTAFDKFENSGDGQLGEWEFTQCWVFLGLKASESEIKSIFKSVDANNSGFIDFNEFKTAIKSERNDGIKLDSSSEQDGRQVLRYTITIRSL
eukprot:TRINITY_DN276_c0_g1_i2.p1 TRINITY_DN276_c0_g1~~TRINITY_DN276_c0_g1_i2.p1  ORF type:complete len:863 (-),score=234.47 TRINITY_DN276_c0_g1_i2:191-2779(-)